MNIASERSRDIRRSEDHGIGRGEREFLVGKLRGRCGA